MPSLSGERSPGEPLKNGNSLIDSLPVRQRKGVLALCDRVDIALGTVLCKAGEPFQYVYFPISGSVSLMRSHHGRDPLETESVGSEGMLGAVLVLNINRAFQSGVVQTPCVALRMTGARMRAALKNQPALFRALQRYLYVVLSELPQTASCINFHDVGNRLAKSLLQAHDRSPSDQLSLTHQRLADMLGVQRGAVTIAAIKLQREEIIRYSRGRITILDRKRLEESSCGCYNESLNNYSAIFS
ncbi:Crp/Fnr family transcriptional regulator [Marinimicrobium sp. LS-A18]|uniref:Crp/Fnr family transcriptional regulator n=1 Tax=Marinimicrobium sp. LS-A18 TaxID=1381596 RepID=UPI0004673AFA|nr:Crp/Fnr family transcriptional regulator [Marinimicrobium sp. LS-A18]